MFNKIYEKVQKYIKENYKFLIFLTILIFLFYYEYPYIIYKSGGTINLEDRIEIDTEYSQEGDISMSYVTAMKGTAPFILLSFVMPDWDLYPLEEITSEESYDEVLEVGKEYLNEGIDNAIIAAFNESDYSITITKEINKVIYLSNQARTTVEVGDEILSVNNQKVNNIEEVKSYVNTLNENDKVIIEVINSGKNYKREAIIYRDLDDSLKIGVAFKTTYEYETEIPVTIKMKDNESGSSGGLMMSLAIYNALTEEDITKGLNIVGTGSILSDGTVEEIGGVKYKVLAAEKKGADIFFCPEENYKEATGIKEKRGLSVEIVKVATLKDAISYLENK
ncbi:MAG: hypothetical protein E7161_04580 [Firmicutes bacterium]|nr:hypothetical protein [Bacillota bacterium]